MFCYKLEKAHWSFSLFCQFHAPLTSSPQSCSFFLFVCFFFKLWSCISSLDGNTTFWSSCYRRGHTCMQAPVQVENTIYKFLPNYVVCIDFIWKKLLQLLHVIGNTIKKIVFILFLGIRVLTPDCVSETQRRALSVEIIFFLSNQRTNCSSTYLMLWALSQWDKVANRCSNTGPVPTLTSCQHTMCKAQSPPLCTIDATVTEAHLNVMMLDNLSSCQICGKVANYFLCTFA